MARLVRYAQTHPIASPFFETKLGGEICYTCRNLFRDFQSKFEDEFLALKKEQDCAGNVSCKGFCNSISLPEQFKPRQEEVKERGINELIKNVNAHFNIWQIIKVNSKYVANSWAKMRNEELLCYEFVKTTFVRLHVMCLTNLRVLQNSDFQRSSCITQRQ